MASGPSWSRHNARARRSPDCVASWRRVVASSASSNRHRGAKSPRVATSVVIGRLRRTGVTSMAPPRSANECRQMTVLRTSRADHGIASRTLQREAAQQRLIRISRGIYVRHESDDPEQQWLDGLDAHMQRGGPDAAVSHRAAARLHGLEGFAEGPRFDDVTVPIDSAWRSSPAIRSAHSPRRTCLLSTRCA